MRARRGAALLLSCVLGLFLLSAVHASAAAPKHVVRGVALLAPAGPEAPYSWRSASDDAIAPEGNRAVSTTVRSGAAATVGQLRAADGWTSRVRGPPGSALG